MKPDSLPAAGGAEWPASTEPDPKAIETSGRSAGEETFRESKEPRVTRRDRFSPGLVERACRIFGARLGREVSEADARILLGDLTDFYELAIARRHEMNGAGANERRDHESL